MWSKTEKLKGTCKSDYTRKRESTQHGTPKVMGGLSLCFCRRVAPTVGRTFALDR